MFLSQNATTVSILFALAGIFVTWYFGRKSAMYQRKEDERKAREFECGIIEKQHQWKKDGYADAEIELMIKTLRGEKGAE